MPIQIGAPPENSFDNPLGLRVVPAKSFSKLTIAFEACSATED